MNQRLTTFRKAESGVCLCFRWMEEQLNLQGLMYKGSTYVHVSPASDLLATLTAGAGNHNNVEKAVHWRRVELG